MIFSVSGSFDRSAVVLAALEKCSHGQLCLLCIDLDRFKYIYFKLQLIINILCNIYVKKSHNFYTYVCVNIQIDNVTQRQTITCVSYPTSVSHTLSCIYSLVL